MKYSKICKEFKNFKERLSSELDSKNAFFTLFSGQRGYKGDKLLNILIIKQIYNIQSIIFTLK